MGRNFDEEREEWLERDRTFTIKGETLTFRRAVRPETFNEIVSPLDSTKPTDKAEDTIRRLDETIMAFLDSDEDRETWERIRAIEEDAITTREMRGILNFIVDEQVGRPTEAPVSSGNGRETTGKRSTASSSSAQGARVASGG